MAQDNGSSNHGKWMRETIIAMIAVASASAAGEILFRKFVPDLVFVYRAAVLTVAVAYLLRDLVYICHAWLQKRKLFGNRQQR